MRKDIKTALGIAVTAAMLVTPVFANANDTGGAQPQQDQASQSSTPSQTNKNQESPTQTAQEPSQKQPTSDRHTQPQGQAQSDKTKTQDQSSAMMSTSATSNTSAALSPKEPTLTVGPQSESTCSDNGATQGNLVGGNWELSMASGTCTLTIKADPGQEAQIPDNEFFRNIHNEGNFTYTDVDFAGKTALPADSSNLFNGIQGLKHLHHTGNVDASHVTNMLQMFEDSDFEELDLSGWGVSNVTDASAFSNLRNCKSLNLSGWKLNSLQSTTGLTNVGDSLETLVLDDVSVPQLTSLESLITDEPNLKTVSMRNFSAASATDVRHLFDSPRQSLEKIDMGHADFSAATDLMGLFSETPKLNTLDISSFSAPKATDMSYLFEDLTNLTNLNVDKLDTSNVTNMSHMFDNCTSLTSLDLSSWDTSSVQEMSAMFRQCQHVTSIDLHNWDTRNVTSMDRLFSGDDKLSAIDMSSFITNNNTYMDNLFEGDLTIKQISIGPHTQLSGWQPPLFASFNEPYTGKWVKVYQPGSALSAEEASRTYDWTDIQSGSCTDAVQAAGTYVWQENRTLTLKPETSLPAGTHLDDETAMQYHITGGHAEDVHVDGKADPQNVSTLGQTLPDTNPYKLLGSDNTEAKDYTFAWNTKEDGTGSSYKPGDVANLADGDITLYATWKAKPKPKPIQTITVRPKPQHKPVHHTTVVPTPKPDNKPSKPDKPGKPSESGKPSGSSKPSHNDAASSATSESKPAGSSGSKPTTSNGTASSNKTPSSSKQHHHKTTAAPEVAGVVIITPSTSSSSVPAAQNASSATGSARRAALNGTKTNANGSSRSANAVNGRTNANLRSAFGLAVATPQLPMPNDQALGESNNTPKTTSPKKSQQGCEPIAYLEGSASPVAYRCDAQDKAAQSAMAQPDSMRTVPVWPFILLVVLAICAMVYVYERRNSTISSQHRANQ